MSPKETDKNKKEIPEWLEIRTGEAKAQEFTEIINGVVLDKVLKEFEGKYYVFVQARSSHTDYRDAHLASEDPRKQEMGRLLDIIIAEADEIQVEIEIYYPNGLERIRDYVLRLCTAAALPFRGKIYGLNGFVRNHKGPGIDMFYELFEFDDSLIAKKERVRAEGWFKKVLAESYYN